MYTEPSKWRLDGRCISIEPVNWLKKVLSKVTRYLLCLLSETNFFSCLVLTMSGVDEPSTAPKLLCSFNSKATIQEYAKGCDADIGGTSSVNLTLDESGPKPTAKFWGDMRLGVRPELQGRVRGGYAGFRSMVR